MSPKAISFITAVGPATERCAKVEAVTTELVENYFQQALDAKEQGNEAQAANLALTGVMLRKLIGMPTPKSQEYIDDFKRAMTENHS